MQMASWVELHMLNAFSRLQSANVMVVRGAGGGGAQCQPAAQEQWSPWVGDDSGFAPGRLLHRRCAFTLFFASTSHQDSKTFSFTLLIHRSPAPSQRLNVTCL